MKMSDINLPGIVYVLSYGVALWCIIAGAYLFILSGTAPFRFQLIAAAIIVTGGVIICILHGLIRRAEVKFQRLISGFKCADFSPNANYELTRNDIGTYFGIDTTHGTILMVSLHDKIFKGKELADYAGYYCEGTTMTITFNDVNFPTFKLRMRSGSKCREFAHRLDVLKSASYRPEKQPGSDFGMHVQRIAPPVA
ncbi:hypothetical protein MUA03_17105 [Enterobacteriaceae bacterium H16N7]|nr:hypothetical protein [Dryocola clanedunensis]